MAHESVMCELLTNNASLLVFDGYFFPAKAKIDVVVDKALDLVYKPVALVGSVGGRLTKNQKLASGGAAAVVGGGVSMTLMALSVPVVFMAVLFLPLTLMGGVSGDGAQGGCVVGLALAPRFFKSRIFLFLSLLCMFFVWSFVISSDDVFFCIFVVVAVFLLAQTCVRAAVVCVE